MNCVHLYIHLFKGCSSAYHSVPVPTINLLMHSRTAHTSPFTLAVLIGRITGLARPSVRLSRRGFLPRQQKAYKNKIGVNIPRGRINRRHNFPFKRSKIWLKLHISRRTAAQYVGTRSIYFSSYSHSSQLLCRVYCTVNACETNAVLFDANIIAQSVLSVLVIYRSLLHHIMTTHEVN